MTVPAPRRKKLGGIESPYTCRLLKTWAFVYQCRIKGSPRPTSRQAIGPDFTGIRSIEMAQAVAKREDMATEFTWNIESVFPSDKEWEAAIAESSERLSKFEGFRGHLADGPNILLEALQELEGVLSILGKVYVYASMLHDADTADQEAGAKNDRAGALVAHLMASVAFVDPELLSMLSETLREWVRSDPRLRTYEHYVDKLERRRAHVRSAEVEEVVGMATNPFRTARITHGILADADLKFSPATSSSGDKIEISQGNIDALLTDSDREVRRTAWESYADAHLAFKNTMASCLSGGVKQDVFQARVHNYSSSLEAALAPTHIPVEVFYRLVDTYRRHLPTWHKYWKIRREALHYETLHEYDIKAPLMLDSPKVPLDQSVDWILKGMAPLGEEYVRVLEAGMRQQRWVDVYPNEGKRAGAYSGGWPGTYPFILMSYTDDIFSMSTLAHELGHSLQSYYAWKNQPLIYANYSTFVAEVASNFNQALVRRHLLDQNQDRDFQIALIEETMSNFHRYFFIMPTLARFELEIHERTERDEPLTAEALITLMTNLFKEGYGNEIEINAERTGITWAEFPTHLYMNFYVFQYATGISAAHALSKRVLEEGDTAAQAYLDFLKAGDSMYPMDALKMAGVDMTSADPVEDAFAFLEEIVDRLGNLLQSRSAG